ncbi:MAG: ABC transporter permease [Bacillota bacterium]
MKSLKAFIMDKPSPFVCAIFLFVWEIGVHMLKVPTFILPPPSKVLSALWLLRRTLFVTHLPVTLLEIISGLAISIVISIMLSMLMLYQPFWEKSLYPFLVASQTIPIIVLSPILIMWFGYGLGGKIAVTVLITFFPIVVNTFDGLKNVDIQYINLLRTMGANDWQIFCKVRVPAALPSFFTGVRVGAAVSVIGAVIGEWLGGNAGLGSFSRRMTSNLQADAVLAAVLILAGLGIGLFWLVKVLERYFIPWYYNQNHKERLK